MSILFPGLALIFLLRDVLHTEIVEVSFPRIRYWAVRKLSLEMKRNKQDTESKQKKIKLN